ESSYQSPLVYASTLESDDLEALSRSVDSYPRRFPQHATWLRPSRAPLVKNDLEDRRRGTPPEDRFAVQRGFNVPLLFGGVTFKALSPEEMRDNPPHKKMQIIENGEITTVPRPFRIFNSAVLLDGEGRVQGLYNKTYLLAFGEYIPGADLFPWIYDLIPAASDFTPGSEVVAFPFKGYKLGVMICYEDIIPAYGRKLAKQGPNVLINVTNDAWFGKTNEPYLHLALATFRAVESRKWLLRSTNTGVTAFIDATGRIISQTSIYEPEVLAEDVAMMSPEPTPYVIIGDVLGYMGLVSVVVLVGLARRREDETPAGTPSNTPPPTASS
ncbi:MAG: apolipoprotein N-acyltransferase, partial [Myxococcota bacterium]